MLRCSSRNGNTKWKLKIVVCWVWLKKDATVQVRSCGEGSKCDMRITGKVSDFPLLVHLVHRVIRGNNKGKVGLT